MQKVFDKAKIRKEIERERRKRVKARLRELRELIRQARRNRREAVREIRLDCRAQREKVRNTCALRRERAKAEGEQQIAARRAELKDEKLTESRTRAVDRRAMTVRSTARERRQETDDAVRRDIPPELVPVFEQVKRHIKGGPRKTRSEAFMEWAEENPGEVYAIQSRDAERGLSNLIAEYQRLDALAHRESLAGVPF